MQIVPSILEKNAEDFINQVNKLTPYFTRFQIDIADGRLVPNKTIQIENVISAIEQCNNETINKLTFDFHLMVEDYEAEIKKLAQLKERINIKTVFIHFSLFPNLYFLTTNFQFTIGLVLNPQDQVDDLARQYNLKEIKAVQIMSIDPGFQGRPFIPETLNKIEQLRNLGYRNEVYLDGGVRDKTLSVILSKKFKPDVLCVGSFLTKTENLLKNIQLLKKNITV